MRYRTVKDVIDFVSELTANNLADRKLKIRVEFYHEGAFVGELERNMWTYRTATALKRGESLLDYLVTDFKIEARSYCIAFVLNIKEPSSI
jgi:hypothetical protein